MPLPKTNQKLSLRILQGPWEGLYSTYVEAIDQSELVVAQPMFGGELVPLRPGDEVLVEFVENREQWAFSAHVIRLFSQGVALVSLTVPAPSEVSRHQQRHFVRLDVSLPLQYRPLEHQPEAQAEVEPEGEAGAEPDAKSAAASGYRRGRTVDISGNGAQIVVHEAYPVGARLDLVIGLPDAEVAAEAEVVRLVQQVSPGEAWLGVRFTRLEERDRERIIRFIFAEQRLRRKKGLL